ncbi:MAG: LamG domain-containing protein [Bacteroidales bacterium]|jgi:hypothetical protein|nr:LamG domain-containing protein [Bacteroidales bacterium]
MKTNKIIAASFIALSVASATMTGCYEGDLYDVGQPDWLQSTIDSIAAANASNGSSGDTTFITLENKSVGASDNTDGWWTVFSDYFKVGAGQKLVLEFTNYSSGANNWNNWNLACANAERDASGYAEYFVIRSDAYGWGDGYQAALMSTDYFEEGKAADWAQWLAAMNGAEVTMEIDHAAAGPTYVTVTQIGNDGITYTETFTCESTKAEILYTWLVCDGSHFEMKRAYLLPSDITEIEDQQPVSIAISGAPTAIELGDENFWKGATATVSFADGTTAQVDSADLTFMVVPDLTTVGSKTVTVAYSKTKQGNYGKAVASFYTFTVTAPISSIEIEASTTTYYYEPGTTAITKDDIDVASFIKSVIGKTGTTDIAIPSTEYSAEVTTLPATMTDKIVITVTYKDLTATLEVSLEQLDTDNLILTGKIVGDGEFVDDEIFGKVYKNNTDNVAIRANYLTLPTDKINACADAGRLTISFWIKNYNKATISEWSPIFMIKNGDVNSEWLYYIFRHKGQLLVNYAGWVDSPLADGWSAETDWLNGNDDWHYVVATVSNDDLTLYVDGEVLSSCSPDGADGNNTTGFISGLADINFFALGGAQTNGWGDPDVPCMYADLNISSAAPTAEAVKAEYDAKK